MNNLTRQIADILKNADISNFHQEARWIAEESPSPDTAIHNAEQRAAGVPLQYILGTAPFRDLTLKVDPRVLIPRPETESLVQWVIDHAPANGSLLDLGTGSGAIALAAASERADLTVTAADISPDALALAYENAKICNINNVSFIISDLFSALTDRRFDIVAANLPYVTENEYPDLPDEVRNFEPKLALTAPENGLLLIRKTIEALPSHLNIGGSAIFELSPHQAPVAANLLEKHGFAPAIIRDLCHRDRFVIGTML